MALPDEFVSLSLDVESGETITRDDLEAVPIPGDTDALRKAFIPWKDRAILFGATSNRDYLKGDVVLYRDIVEPEDASQWKVIGPFKLISVGERFKERSNDEFDDSRTDGNTVTIAVDANFDEQTKKLLEVIRSGADGDREEPEIVAVQILPATQQSGRITSSGKEVVFQTVSLEGIANVPTVLLAGDMIRFVVPKRRGY